MPDAFRISTVIPGLPERIYAAWLDSAGHAAFTGGEAKVDPSIGGKFTAWDGYIHGRTVDVLHGRRIVQTWRTKEFPHSAPDSRLEVQFEFVDGGTRVTILHSNIPEGQGERYKKGWVDHYFTPMREYFGRLLAGPGAVPPAKKAKASARASSPPPAKKAAKSAKKGPTKKAAAKPGTKRPTKSAAKRPAPKAKKRKR